MNRTDRLLAIILELQRHGKRRAEDLAATFEVSKRTIYRDIQALAEAGIPLVAMTGHGYSLMDNYFLPPVNFTNDEALILLLGSDIMQQNFDAQYKQAAQSAAKKIETILPKHLFESVEYLRDNIAMFGMKDLNEQKSQQLSQIRRAIIEQRLIQIVYTKRIPTEDQEGLTTRDIAPYSLASLEHDWYVMAYCHLRENIRIFRLSRIDNIQLLPKRFERPSGFSPDWINSQRPFPIIIKVRVTDSVIRWVRESQPYSLIKEEAVDAGWLLTFQVPHEEELLRWILGWGRDIEVLEPLTLRHKIIEEVEQMLKIQKSLLT